MTNYEYNIYIDLDSTTLDLLANELNIEYPDTIFHLFANSFFSIDEIGSFGYLNSEKIDIDELYEFIANFIADHQ